MPVMRSFGMFIATLLVLVLAGCNYRVGESNLVIPRVAPTADITALRAKYRGVSFEEAWIDAADGARLYTLAARRPDAVATVLYFGGNGYTIGRWAARTERIYADVPVDLVLVDHRGYGASTGTPTLDRLMDDADLAFRTVRDDRRFAGRPLIVHGHSLGSFMAGRVAAVEHLDGLVLEATAPTAEAWASQLRSIQKPWVRAIVWRVKPTGALAGRGTAAIAAGLDEPVMFVVGADDAITPPRFARELFDSTPAPAGRKQLVVVPDATHLQAAESAQFRAAFARLLDQAATEHRAHVAR
jgi:pimeloyl-ACP methyl ester carboxylesterase